MLSSSLCSAAVYNVKYLHSAGSAIPTTSLQGVLGTTGETWNQANGSWTNLNDSTGVASTIDISGLSGGENAGPAGIFNQNSNKFAKGDNQTISISQLTAGGVYDIYIYALSHNNTSWGPSAVAPIKRAAGAFTTANATGNGSSQSLDNGITGTDADPFTAGSNYVLFQSIVADGSGNISIVADALDGANATRLHVNGLQIVSIPETSSAALLGLGAFALILRRRK